MVAHGKLHRPPGHRVERIAYVFIDRRDAELAKADEYEPAGYKRIVATLASGKHAWVYADARFA